MFPLLPPTLVLLILALPAFAAPSSVNDPFKALSAQVVKPPEPPICCLVPLPPTEFSEEDVLLSFEEWKEKAKEQHAPTAVDEQTSSSVAVDTPSVPVDAPHFRIPITDRFNYASLDCSARVHTSHRAAKSPASILSSKRDKYMLSPCRDGNQQFVVVELCDDIRIDTVQLANFEFFSGVFKDITVSVSKTYTTDPTGWTFAGMYTAKNIRVVQSFHPPTSLSDFYRYIRIDFHSHYGNEFYCPVSLLRVYGLTHLEEYKWDLWQTESRARAHVEPPPPLEAHDPASDAPEPVHIPASSYVEYVDKRAMLSPTVKEAPSQETVVVIVPERTTSHPPVPVQSNSSDDVQNTTSPTPVSEQTSESIPEHSTSEHPNGTSSDISASSSATSSEPPNAESVSIYRPSSETTVVATAGGESIYRTIMNRLAALEANHTLYARYVEEHAGAVREVLRRVGEDLGRAEGVGKAQAQMHARALREWERERRRGDGEYAELVRRVEYLSSEIVLEKRLGIAQLLLLLAVLVFMALTRGSRGEVAMVPSMRAWGRRHLSISGEWDWVGRLKSRSRSRTPMPKPTTDGNEPIKAEPSISTPIKHEFPSVEDAEKKAGPSAPSSARKHRPRPLSLHPPRAVSTPSTYPRTPLRRPLTPTPGRVGTPVRPLIPVTTPVIQHSLSQDAHAPRSARRWARTAHLHELRTPRDKPGTPMGMGGGSDVFASPEDLSLRTGGLLASEGEGDPWIDTDLEGSEPDVDLGAGRLSRETGLEPESPIVRRVDVVGG
ncbi:UNC-like C-terminal-domain-containing protein [Roridomyces roridus]|uniref:UNC-like C-terminal-domain-containing protein n=1 Tax=Roridomyces roridus TaxID=1738132 RepID=A0AAD7BXF4_9AGAR|nr:UNC-like C-terminal-domain-containing protein [Roridomyces roridus]